MILVREHCLRQGFVKKNAENYFERTQRIMVK